MTGRFKVVSIEAVLKLITSMKNVINWKTISRIGVRFGSNFSGVLDIGLNRSVRVQVACPTAGDRSSYLFDGGRRIGRRSFRAESVVHPTQQLLRFERGCRRDRRDAIAEYGIEIDSRN